MLAVSLRKRTYLLTSEQRKERLLTCYVSKQRKALFVIS